MELSLTFKIDSIDCVQELIDCVNEFLEFKEKQRKKQNKTAADGRGKHIKALHLRAKQYQMENPGLSYRECIKAVSTNLSTK